MFKAAKNVERQGKWGEAATLYKEILTRAPLDSYSHLALARLEARRELKQQPTTTNNEESDVSLTSMIPSKAQAAFANGTAACPDSVHLWQAWAIYEESQGNTDRARELFREALTIDEHNPYVCHAFGLMEKKLGDAAKATNMFEQALSNSSTAALVCSLGEILVANGDVKRARDLYARHLLRLKTEKDIVEVYLASAWLEERYFKNFDRAQELLHSALTLSPGSSLANVALARLEGRIQRRNNKNDHSGNKATAKRLANVCNEIQKGKQRPSDPTDGRVFNALANLEVKSRRYSTAREILKRGMDMYPQDHAVSISSLLLLLCGCCCSV
jgi:tetratricopeptide (TPR) repeat protein